MAGHDPRSGVPAVTQAFPLQWPDGWPRAERRQRSRYQVSFARARDGVLDSLRLMGARSVVVSTNVELRRDGLPYAREAQKRHDDPGVAVFFYWRDESHVIACDAWELVRDNMRAIGHTIEGLRAIERAGASELLHRAFTGFKALPAPHVRSWRDVLEFGPSDLVAPSMVYARFRKLAKERHPDAGGSDEAMAELVDARDRAIEAMS